VSSGMLRKIRMLCVIVYIEMLRLVVLRLS